MSGRSTGDGLAVTRDGRDDGKPACVQQVAKHCDVRVHLAPDVSERRVRDTGRQQTRVLTTDANRAGTGAQQLRDHALVHRAGQQHAHDIEVGLAGDAPAAAATVAAVATTSAVAASGAATVTPAGPSTGHPVRGSMRWPKRRPPIVNPLLA